MDILALKAVLGIDTKEFNRGIDDSEKKFSMFGDMLKANLVSKGIELAAKGVMMLGKATVDMVSQSVNAYANYEQLVGGVETLFKGSADKVQQYAENAYKTAGLSANEYMETVTSFSASLLQSLGGDTAKAADMADMAITDMSDNANKMGTDMAAIQNAYNGFAKQNYTMLDNLKLGYGGTKQEMERLLKDAEKLSGQKFDVSSYGDIVQAIHIVQTEMGITGTTAKEASETISGSLNMLKGAWTNLITGLGNENANFDQLVSNVVDSAVIAGNNLIPRIQNILMGIATLVEKLAPVIADKLPGLVQQILPPLLNAAQSLLQSFVAALPDIIKVLIDVLPGLVDMLINTIADMSPELVELGVELIIALAEGLIVAIPKLVEKAPEIITRIVTALVNHAPELLNAGIRLIAALAAGIIQSAGNIVSAIGNIINVISDGIGNLISGAVNWGKDLINNFTAGIRAFINKPIDAVKGLAGRIKSFLGFSEPEEGPLANFHTYAPDMMALFAKGISDNQGLITKAIAGAFDLQPQITANVNDSAAGREFAVPRGEANRNSDRPLVMVLDGQVFARVIAPYMDAERLRVGLQMSTGGTL